MTTTEQLLKPLHQRFVMQRRIAKLSKVLSGYIDPRVTSLLDIGTGDGAISKRLSAMHPGLKITGIDNVARLNCAIPCRMYDGRNIPFDDNSFDTCMLVDVLHHLPGVKDIRDLLAEARRVATNYILIKDHLYKTQLDFSILKFMDRVGNRPYGVALAYNYLREKEWNAIFRDANLVVEEQRTTIGLYPFPFSLIFGGRLHFACLLKITK